MHRKRFYLDNSRLAAFASCELGAMLEYVYDRRGGEQSNAAEVGVIVHEALAKWYGGDRDSTALTRYIGREISRRVAPHMTAGIDDRLSAENVCLVMEEWFNRAASTRAVFDPIVEDIESGIEVPLGGVARVPGALPVEAYYYALIDLPARTTDTGEATIVDHKTTGRIDRRWKRKWGISSQLIGYAWAAERVYDSPVNRVFVNAIELGKLPTGNRKCRTHSVSYDQCRALHVNAEILTIRHTAETKRHWEATMRQLAAAYIALAQYCEQWGRPAIPNLRPTGAFTGACWFCALAEWCKSGRSVELLDTYTVESKWAPWERKGKSEWE